MKEYYVITNQDGIISLKKKSTPKRDPPSQEDKEIKNFSNKKSRKIQNLNLFLKKIKYMVGLYLTL